MNAQELATTTTTDRARLLTGPLTGIPAADHVDAIALRYLAGYAGNTRKAYGNDLADYFAWCRSDGVNVMAATRSDVDVYARHLTERPDHPLTAVTVARRLSTLAGFYRYAMSEDLLTRSPIEFVKRPKRPKVSQDSQQLGLDKDEARRLLAGAAAYSTKVRGDKDRPRALALVTLLLHTGMRISEALNADVTDLATIRGNRTLSIVRKGGARYSAFLNAPTTEALDAYVAGRTSGPLFATATGRWDRAEAFNTVRAIAKAAGLDNADRIGPHSLRHTFVTLAREKGVALEDVQDAAGHADPKTTRRYDRGRFSLDRHPAPGPRARRLPRHLTRPLSTPRGGSPAMNPPSTAPDPLADPVCACGRPAITVLTGLAGPDGESTIPWCGAHNLPPLPGSKQALKQEEAWRADTARANDALAGIMLAAAQLQNGDDLAELAEELTELADELTNLADERRKPMTTR